MDIDSIVVDYLAQKALSDFKSNTLTNDLAGSFSLRPWIDAIRDNIDLTYLSSIENVLQNPNENPKVTHFAINAVRGIKDRKVIPLIENCFNTSTDLPNIISAMLVLASYGEMEGKWEIALERIGKDTQELIKCVMRFYNCETNEELQEALKQRQGNSNYKYNDPYYDFLLKIID